MIKQCGDGSFYLIQNEALSCLLHISRGKAELLHFGTPIAEQDAEAMAYPANLGWGCSTLYAAGEASSCLDTVPLAWSEAGIGDYREPSLELSMEGRPLVPDFHLDYASFGSEILPMESGLPQAKGECETLALHFRREGEDLQGSLKLTLIFSLFETALTRRTILENETTQEIAVSKLMSACWDLRGDFVLTTLDGGWISETHRHDAPIGYSAAVNSSTVGFSSNRHNAGVILTRKNTGEHFGEAIGLNLIYSGNHYTSAQKSQQELTRIVQGISPDHFRKLLRHGEKLETPESVITWSNRGLNGMSQKMHRFVNEHIVPKAWQYVPRPVLYNSWEGCMFSFHETKLLLLAARAKKLGCEMFVLDDGWFGARNSEKSGLGDYQVNLRKLPFGMKGLADRIHSMGMKFGLWFEPEGVNPDSDLYRAHPDWALHTPGVPDLYGRNELLLDLRLPEVRDYIVENVSRIADEAKLDYIKWDMNRQSPLLGAEAHEYILGLYDVLRRIFEPRPQILLESCSSGGNRFDLGMMCFSPQIWASDDTDPVERLEIQQGLSYLYPLSAMGAHVSAAPHAQTLRATPLPTRANVAFFGAFGVEMDLSHLVSVEEAELKAAISFYQEHRELFQFGEFSRLETCGDAVCWQVWREKEGAVGLFHKLQKAAPGYEWLRALPGKEDAVYCVDSREQSLRVGQFGSLVNYVSPVSMNPNGAIVRTADHYYRMPDAAHSAICSGRALQAGIPLSQRFSGTGYSAGNRNQGDFNSNVFFIKEKPDNE